MTLRIQLGSPLPRLVRQRVVAPACLVQRRLKSISNWSGETSEVVEVFWFGHRPKIAGSVFESHYLSIGGVHW